MENTKKEVKTVGSKLQEARVIILNRNIKKSGLNRKFPYYELEDFIPLVIQTFNDVGLTSSFSFKNRCAKLSIEIVEPYSENMNIRDYQKDFEIEIPDELNLSETVPSSYDKNTNEYKKPNPMQVMGSVNTYLKRYLYMNALELVESDAIDANIGKFEGNKNTNKNISKEDEISNRIYNSNSIGEVNYTLKNFSKDMNDDQKKKLHDIASNRFNATYDKDNKMYVGS